MKKVSLSADVVSINAVWGWYQDQKNALRVFKYQIIESLTKPTSTLNQKFQTYSIDDLEIYFKESERELEYLVCFDLISATEGLLRKDFHSKTNQKDKSDIGRAFREIAKEKDPKDIRLKEDIIEHWKVHMPSKKDAFGNYNGLLIYRHWLAHGRYWNLIKGRKYSADEAFSITLEIVGAFVN